MRETMKHLSFGVGDYARHRYSGMYQVQESQLFDYEEQEDYDRTTGNEEILQYMPASYGTQGNSLVDICRPVALIGRAAVSKTACWGFESLLACQRYLIASRVR